MKFPNSLKIIIISMVLFLLIGGAIFYFSKRSEKTTSLELIPNRNMKIISSAFEDNQSIPKKYTCDGENINPPLEIQEVPERTKSLVLIFDDPDAPLGTWYHWLIWNISPETNEISENSLPENAVLGTNSFKKLEYGGPCPPSGTHRYFFRVFALDTVLNLPEGANIRDLESKMRDHILDKAELMGKYSR